MNLCVAQSTRNRALLISASHALYRDIETSMML
jgi:hypothetical protein